MKTTLFFALALYGASAAVAGEAGRSSLPRSSPEAEGVEISGIMAFVDAAEKKLDAIHSLMLVRHGHVVAEGWWAPYGPDSPHSLFSLSKSFTSTAVGLAVAEGKLSIDDPVLKFFPDDAPTEPSKNLKAMRVSDLLRMSTGHQAEPSLRTEKPWSKVFLAQPVPNKPGTHFLYNTAATYMLSAIVQKVTGMTVLDYLRPRLFEPLGIENPTWGTSPQGVTLGGYGLSIRTEDIARFGQLYLQKGRWNGKQLVPESWVDAATARQTSNGSNPESDWDQGYGYQFWRCRNGAFRGDGAFGQFCIVLPDQDAVIAITSGVSDMQAVLNLVWEHLLPALKPTALTPDGDAREKLRQRLAKLALHTQEGRRSASVGADVSGKKYEFPKNDRKLEEIVFENGEGEKRPAVVVRSNGVESRISCGHGEWTRGRLTLTGRTAEPVAVSGAWTSDDTFTARICYYEAPFLDTLRLTFKGEELRAEVESTVGFGPSRRIKLTGKRLP